MSSMLKITSSFFIKLSEIKFSFIHASGPGGQNVNKVATAVQLRFNIVDANLSETLRLRLISQLGNKLTTNGDIIIKASRFRTQERNKQDALQRLQQLLMRAATPAKKRHPTKPTQASQQRRLATKKIAARTKSIRSNKVHDD